jgi:ornithine cyclodeaminase
MQACIDVMANAMRALASHQVEQPLRMMVRPPQTDSLMAVMPAYMARSQGPAVYGLKAVCVFPGNSALGKDAHQGAVLLCSGETGELLAVMNASALTALRTAAVSGVATRYLARPEASDLALIGAGVQARTHLAAMACVRPPTRVRVASRTFAHACAFAEELGPRYAFPIVPVETVEAAVRDADIIVTATTATQPIVHHTWIAPGTHLNVIGSFAPDKREVDTATIVGARVFVDRRESALKEAGDYLLAAREGVIGPRHICAELGEVLINPKLGRIAATDITLFKSVGLSVEDVAAAAYVYRQACERGVGTTAEF